MDEARDAKEERARPVDRRVVRTKNAIRQAFFKLVDERDYDKVTVAALAREANIDRKTFYLHYASIDDVVDEIIRENVGRIVAVLEREQGAKGERSWLDVENFFTLLSMDLAHSFVESRRRVFHLPVEELLWKVELMRKTANSTSTADRAAIQLDTCIVRVSKNWFVVVGTCQK